MPNGALTWKAKSSDIRVRRTENQKDRELQITGQIEAEDNMKVKQAAGKSILEVFAPKLVSTTTIYFLAKHGRMTCFKDAFYHYPDGINQ